MEMGIYSYHDVVIITKPYALDKINKILNSKSLSIIKCVL